MQPEKEDTQLGEAAAAAAAGTGAEGAGRAGQGPAHTGAISALSCQRLELSSDRGTMPSARIFALATAAATTGRSRRCCRRDTQR